MQTFSLAIFPILHGATFSDIIVHKLVLRSISSEERITYYLWTLLSHVPENENKLSRQETSRQHRLCCKVTQVTSARWDVRSPQNTASIVSSRKMSRKLHFGLEISGRRGSRQSEITSWTPISHWTPGRQGRDVVNKTGKESPVAFLSILQKYCFSLSWGRLYLRMNQWIWIWLLALPGWWVAWQEPLHRCWPELRRRRSHWSPPGLCHE